MSKKVKITTGFATMEKFDNRVKNTVGSSRIRARWLIDVWPEAEEFIIGKNYNVMVFQKVYWEKMKKTFDGIKILDLCDPDWLEGKPVLEFADMCDAVTTSTEALAEYIKLLRPKMLVKCVPDRIYLPEHKPRTKPHKGKIKSAVWFGYHHNTHYLTKTFDDLLRYQIKLTVISQQEYKAPMAYQSLEIENVPYAYPGIHTELTKHDILIMPKPIEDEKGRFKSNNKILTGWALGVPVVTNSAELDAMLEGEARQKEADEKLQVIKDKWDVKLSVQEMKDIIEECKKRRSNGQ